MTRGILLGLLVLAALVLLFMSIRIVQQYQSGVVYRLGRVTGARHPGLNFIIPFLERMEKVMVAVVALELDPQQVITQDSVSLAISAVVYFRVSDPIRAEVEVDDYEDAINLRAQSVLRQVIGASSLEKVLAHSEEVAASIKSQLESVAESWGLEVQSIELKDVKLPKSMQRAMAAPAEATRVAAAKVVEATGERDSAALLREAADQLSPAALRLRELQVTEAIGADNATVVVVSSASSGEIAGAAAAGAIAAR